MLWFTIGAPFDWLITPFLTFNVLDKIGPDWGWWYITWGGYSTLITWAPECSPGVCVDEITWEFLSPNCLPTVWDPIIPVSWIPMAGGT